MESGAPEIYLTAFPDGTGKWQATPDGGNAPHWSRDGKQLVYAKSDRLKVIDFHDGVMPGFGPPVPLPSKIVSDRIFLNSYSGYAVAPDGRFIITQPVGPTQPTIHLVTNWKEIFGVWFSIAERASVGGRDDHDHQKHCDGARDRHRSWQRSRLCPGNRGRPTCAHRRRTGRRRGDGHRAHPLRPSPRGDRILHVDDPGNVRETQALAARSGDDNATAL